MTQPGTAIVPADTTEGGVYCGARARGKNPYCRQRAGHGTDHKGQGRCKYHGGATPITSGRGSRSQSRFSRINRPRLRELYEQFEADEDPLNILPELAAARALFVDFIERYDEWREAFLAWHASFESGEKVQKPREVLDVSAAMGHVDTVTKIVERIEKIRAANAISRQDLVRLMGQMGNAVERHVREAVPDEAAAVRTLKAIRADWLSLAVA